MVAKILWCSLDISPVLAFSKIFQFSIENNNFLALESVLWDTRRDKIEHKEHKEANIKKNVLLSEGLL